MARLGQTSTHFSQRLEHCRQRSASARAASSLSVSSTRSNPPRWSTGSRSGSCCTTFLALAPLTSTISSSVSLGSCAGNGLNSIPNRAHIASAARRPSAQAAMMIAGPRATSPPAYTPSAARAVASSVTMDPSLFSDTSVPSIKAISGFCPIARMIESASIWNSLPSTGSGLRRPSGPGSPSSLRTHSSAVTCPSVRSTRRGEANSISSLPSSNRSRSSSSSAGISACVRR